jgi:hypothetical protein
VAEEPETWELALGGPVGTLTAAITAIATAGNESLTHNRGVIDLLRGYILTPIDQSLSAAEQQALHVNTRPAIRIGELIAAPGQMRDELQEVLDFVLPPSIDLPELLENLARDLLHPTYIPGEPCRAPTPLLRDLLDVALGRVTGGIDATIRKVGQTVEDLLFPAFGTAQDLARDVQSILADPVTAALNMVLGQRGAIECGVDASLGVGIGVVETGIERLVRFITKALP